MKFEKIKKLSTDALNFLISFVFFAMLRIFSHIDKILKWKGVFRIPIGADFDISTLLIFKSLVQHLGKELFSECFG